ncbi:hypothetical protein TrVFT333_011718 [Trichoderma virens FT-333]|nr:hypothetical protein TrVFT333_011718 [Trichoderma virens FT-333]
MPDLTLSSPATGYQLCEQCQSLELSVDKFKIGGGSSCNPSSSQSLRPSNGSPFVATLELIESRAPECSLCKVIASAIPPEIRSKINSSTICRLVWELDGRDSLDPSSRKRTRRLPLLLNEETQFLGRRIGPVVNKRNLIREFLRLCETNHDKRCTGKLGIEDPFAETLKQSFFGVIDIQNQNLVPLPYTNNKDYLSFQPYATVSYVWGKIRDHRTTLSNIQDRLKSGGLAQTIDELPIALKQSINLINDLGIRYIWIDSLCIIQDSSHSWNLNSRTMHLIYGNSTLTICAADGASAEVGLMAIDKNHSVEQNIAQVASDVFLVLHQSPESNIEDSVWNQRAWTFQERLLSRRCLIFTKGQVYFQCRSTGMSEDIFVDKTGQGWSLDLTGAPLQTLTQLRQRALWFYINCVGLYTKRDLHEPFDILAAFNGMCKLIEGTLRSPFTFGLPTSHFDFALLWQPVGKSSLLEKPRSSDEKYKSMKFPSWSWCGWKSKGVTYNRQMVEGCVSDVRTWLRDHTWIDWHIRDGYGTPQRIWDHTWAKEDRSTEERWRGYRGRDINNNNNDNNVYERYRRGSPYRSRSRSRSSNGRSRDSNPHGPREYPGYDTHERRPEYLHPDRGRDNKHIVVIRPRSRSPDIDAFGRPLNSSAKDHIKNSAKHSFKLTLPEYPFHVPTAESKCRTGDHREFPDLPILQFFTWSNKLRIALKEAEVTPEMKAEQLTNGITPSTGPQGDSIKGPLRHCYIMDRRGDRCGSIVVDSKWLAKEPLPRQCRFIAISEAKSFTIEEMPEWTYYIPKERVESEWDVYFVLLIEYHAQEGVWKRVALGKVFKTAFTHDEDTWKEILLG